MQQKTLFQFPNPLTAERRTLRFPEMKAILLAAGLPLLLPPSSAVDRVVVVNGSCAEVDLMENTFLFCRAPVCTAYPLRRYKVLWTDGEGRPIPRRDHDAPVFTLGSDHVPHSYLVFHDFSPPSAGVYTCQLFHEGSLAHSTSITVQLRRRNRSLKGT